MKALGPSQEVDSTGISGFDSVLRGGLPRNQLYLLEGSSGAGKTTLALQFLIEGAKRGEKVMWCTLSETEAQLHATARSHGWDLAGIDMLNLTRSGTAQALTDTEYSFFSPGDIELQDVTQAIIDVTTREKPQRMVFDPFSDVKLLARDSLRYRRQVLQLREHFSALGTTVILIQERGLEAPSDPAAEAVVHGIFELSQHAPDYGKPRRRLRVHKLRGVNYREGYHDVTIATGGITVFPRLIAAEHAKPAIREVVSSGVPHLDEMMGGGLDRGASMLIMGPAGAGKSTLVSKFALAAADRGEISALFLFDETERAFLSRAEGLGMPIRRHVEGGTIRITQVDPAEFTPGEFAHAVRRQVEVDNAGLVAIDSLNGYLTAMPDEQHLAMHMHELLTYLSLQNSVTVLTLNQHGLVGGEASSPVEVSYLADSAILLRYFEAAGAVRRAISVVKRRGGPHEVHIREMTVSPPGVQLGETLREFRGVLTGQPDYAGPPRELSGGEAGPQGRANG
jgi:circadian clock protein KaiC